MKVGIFGAGIAGLAVAWLLGENADVWVHEASGTIGGLARSFMTRSRSRHATGPMPGA